MINDDRKLKGDLDAYPTAYSIVSIQQKSVTEKLEAE
jgi:hypothetical protein